MRRRSRILLKAFFRNLTFFLFLPASIIFATRLIWGYQAAHRMHRAASILRSIPDPSPPAPPGSKTARQAIDDIYRNLTIDKSDLDLMTGEGKLYGILDNPWTFEENQRVEAILKTHEVFFEQIDPLESISLAQTPMETDPYYATLGHLDSETENFPLDALIQNARLAFEQHNETTGFHALCRAIILGNTFAKIPTYYYAQLAIVRARLIPAACIEKFEPQLHLTDPDAIAQAHHLITLLLNDSFLDAENARTIIGTALYIENHPPHTNQFLGWWGAPLRDDSTARLIEHVTSFIPALIAPNYPQAKAIPDPFPFNVRSPSDLDALLDQLEGTIGSDGNIRLVTFAKMTDRAAAILLAARLFQARTGNFPTTAAVLLPDFLPAIPLDPFTVDQPLHYRVDPGGSTIWSVGEDGIDNHGTTILRNSDGTPKSRLRQPDLLFGEAWRKANAPPAPTTSRPATTATDAPSIQ